jgi:iron complex transport system permease protein
MSRKAFALAILCAALAAAIWLRLSVGGEVSDNARAQVMALREGRVIMGLIVGAGLSVAGVMLQSLLRNPLASPDLLGLASGSGLAVMLTLFIQSRVGVGHEGIGTSAAALVGAMAALALVFALSQRRGLLEPVTLVLVGVVVSIMCSAGTELVRSLMGPNTSLGAGRLLMGSLRDDVAPSQTWIVGLVTLAGILVGVAAGKAMDAAALGEDEARSVGVPLGSLRAVLFITAGVLCAGSVVLAGPIGFVGLICPHAVRLLAGPSHRTLVIGAAIAGGTLVILADALSRVIDLGAGHPPISVLTSLVGGPVLVMLLRRERH